MGVRFGGGRTVGRAIWLRVWLVDRQRDDPDREQMHMHGLKSVVVVCASMLLAVGAGCSSSGTGASAGAVMTKDAQAALTPDAAIGMLRAGNERFVAGRPVHRDAIAQQRATAKGQYPFAAVVSCIDSRSIPEVVFDQGIGDLFVPRIAGNYVQADILGSLEFATELSGAKAIVVMGHTECGAVKGACDHVEMGNLTTVMHELRPAVDGVPGWAGERTSANKAFVHEVAVENVRLTMEKIRRDSPIIRSLEEQGRVRIVGAMHDISTGAVVFLD